MHELPPSRPGCWTHTNPVRGQLSDLHFATPSPDPDPQCRTQSIRWDSPGLATIVDSSERCPGRRSFGSRSADRWWLPIHSFHHQKAPASHCACWPAAPTGLPHRGNVATPPNRVSVETCGATGCIYRWGSGHGTAPTDRFPPQSNPPGWCPSVRAGRVRSPLAADTFVATGDTAWWYPLADRTSSPPTWWSWATRIHRGDICGEIGYAFHYSIWKLNVLYSLFTAKTDDTILTIKLRVVIAPSEPLKRLMSVF